MQNPNLRPALSSVPAAMAKMAPVQPGSPATSGMQPSGASSTVQQLQDSAQAVFSSDPIHKLQSLIQKDLRSTLTNLTRGITHVTQMRLRALKKGDGIAVPTPAPASVPPASVGPPSVQGLHDGADERQPPSVQSHTGADGSGAVDKHKAESSESAAAAQLQRQLEHFHYVCDQIEHLFILIVESQKTAKSLEKTQNHQIRCEDSGAPSLVQPITTDSYQGTLTYGQHRFLAEQQFRYTSVIQEAMSRFRNSLAVISDKEKVQVLPAKRKLEQCCDYPAPVKVTKTEPSDY